jgi:hypothetical protein
VKNDKGKRLLAVISLILVAETFTVSMIRATPPFGGTIFLDPDVITESDPTAYQKLTDAGRGQRSMYDRRADWVDLNAFLFNASFSDGPDIEIQVNPEFGDVDTARAEALKYAPVIGRLPKCLRKDVETGWIHLGNNPFGGGNENLLIHTGQAEQYSADGILEETLVHEAAHTSLDAAHANASEWLAAQDADGKFISTYARNNPYREDIAESFLPYFAFRYRSDRLTKSLADVISKTIANRIAYFDKQEFDVARVRNTPGISPIIMVPGGRFSIGSGITTGPLEVGFTMQTWAGSTR